MDVARSAGGERIEQLHFLRPKQQVVWKETKELGVGVSADSTGNYVACRKSDFLCTKMLKYSLKNSVNRYRPPGNDPAQMAENVEPFSGGGEGYDQLEQTQQHTTAPYIFPQEETTHYLTTRPQQTHQPQQTQQQQQQQQTAFPQEQTTQYGSQQQGHCDIASFAQQADR